MRLKTRSPKETEALGEALGHILMPGDTVLMYGEMGAGKSELCRAIAKGLGVQGPVPSPTFTIMQVYRDGRVPLYHFDWYRLSDADELFAMGLDEYLNTDGIALVEWPTQATEAIPERYLRIDIEKQADENERVFELVSAGGFTLNEEEALFERFGD